MRSNGLTAAAYAPVADLDPQLAAVFLDDLKMHGVAAYTTPVESSATAGIDRPEFRHGVKDRLFVDVSQSARVRELIQEQGPDLLDDNEDLTWAQLVAGFDLPYADPVAPWPAAEDVAVQPGAADADADETGGGERPRAYPFRSHQPPYQPPDLPPLPEEASSLRNRRDDDFLASTSSLRASGDDPDRFVPAPPPPLPPLAPYKQLAWSGMVGGPLLLVLSVLAHIVLPGWALFLCVVGFVGGFVTLVATMGERGDDDLGSGDGAVV